MTSPKRDTWRVRSRREIEDTAVAARDAVLRAKTAALQKTKEVEVIDGPPLLEPLDIGDELDRVGYALVHVQAAENELSYLRSLLTKRRERLETERERQLAYGPETYRLFMEAEGSKRRKRIPPAALRSAIQAEWRSSDELGQVTTPWGKRLAYRRIGKGLGVSEGTVRKYVKELETEGVLA